MKTTYRPSIYAWLTALLVGVLLAAYLYADAISITAPPWDYCGFTTNHIGRSFTCIAFDVEPTILK
jgi:hypothetical protein